MHDGEIKNKLSPAQVSVMRHKVTEPPYFGKYWDHAETGLYRCAACDTPLFRSEEKFDSNTGWPTFKKPINERDLQFKSEPGPDDKVEIRCKKCKSHLGYVVPSDPPYYRMNSVALGFEADKIIPPPAVPLPTSNTSQNTNSSPITLPSPSRVSALEIDPIEEPLTTPKNALIIGIVIGILLGFGIASLYSSRSQASNDIPTATSTIDESATSTATTTPDHATTSTTSVKSSSRQKTPAESVKTPEPALDATPLDTGTSTTQ